MAFSYRDQHSWGSNFSEPKFLGDQISWGWGPTFLGTKYLGDQISWRPKKLGVQNEIRDHFSCSQKKRYLKSRTGFCCCCCFTVHFFFWLFKYFKLSALDNEKCTKIKAKKGQNFWAGLKYRGSPTYTKITNTVSTNTFFGLCTCKWGN